MAANGLAKTVESGGETARMRRRMRPRALRTTDTAHESPAVLLQAQLAQSFAEKPLTEDRWSARRSLAFMVVVNGVFWGGLVMMAKALLPAHL